MKKMIMSLSLGIFVLSTSGCFMLLAGGAAGAGTAAWLSGKLTQQVNAPYETTITATEKALASLNLKISKEEKTADVVQLRSAYANGQDIWVDIRKVTATSTKVEVRVGTVSPDKVAAEKILNAIQKNL
jgi:hypothetical protein